MVDDADNAAALALIDNPETLNFTTGVANDPPTVTASGGSAAFTEGGGAVLVDTGLVLADTEGDNISGATVQITGNYQSGADTLAVTDQLGITSSFAAGSGTLTLSGTYAAANP